MAQIKSNAQNKVLSNAKWRGLNENPDGDTKLKYGEASKMLNWKITKDNNLQIRPGYGLIADLGTTPVLGLWNGYVSGVLMTLCSCGGYLYSLDLGTGVKTEIGAVVGSFAHFFGFEGKCYLLTGSKYYCYDGTTLSEVAGYRPLVSITNVPSGGGTSLEQVNKLCGTRRCWFSPDGTATVFQLAETELTSIDYVKNLVTGENYPTTAYTASIENGTVTFTTAPAVGVNTIEIGWTFPTSYRSIVEAMRFSETYNGATDARVFIYGNGTNKTFYSGLDYDGKPRADYFPDLNEIAVDSENTPVTALIRHYDSLLCFKSDSAYIIRYGTLTLADSTITAAFYVTTLNRDIGNVALGQAALVKNQAVTLCGRSGYQWLLSSYGSRDERNAKCITDRVVSTLGGLDLKSALCFDYEYGTEYMISQGGKMVVYNYTSDAWYVYGNIPATCFLAVGGRLYFGTSGGKLMRLSRDYRNDNGADIAATWESGAMDFGADFRLKYSTDVFVVIKPESGARMEVTAQSNRRSDNDVKVVSSGLATFAHVDFNHFSFATSRQSLTDRLHISMKTFTFYRFCLDRVSK